MLSSTLSLDAFAASFAYGSNRIKMPFKSVQTINMVCGSILGISLLLGTALRQYIPPLLGTAICFIILLLLGITKLLDSITKSMIRKHDRFNKEIKFSMFNLRFILKLYADPEKADADGSRILSPAEAASLAVALSLDGITVGFGAALGNVDGLAVFLCSFVTNTFAVLLGCLAGNKAAQKTSFDLSCLSGIMLMAMAFSKWF